MPDMDVRNLCDESMKEWIVDESIVWYFKNSMKMATGGKFLSEGRTEKLLSRILPEVGSSTEEETDRNPSPPPFKVPDGLRSLLNELSKEVLILFLKWIIRLISLCFLFKCRIE